MAYSNREFLEHYTHRGIKTNKNSFKIQNKDNINAFKNSNNFERI